MLKKGFTLIELAITLVIIGLLIGGILTAQSLIETAKTDMLIKNLQQATIMTDNFKTNYRGIPGDTALAATFGDGDGVLEDGDGGSSNLWSGEVAQFWVHANTMGGFKYEKNPYTATLPAGGITAGINVPTSPYGVRGTGFVPVNATYVTNAIGGTVTGTWIVLLGLPSGAGTTITGEHAFNIYRSLAVDTKMDDKLPGAGSIRGGGDASGCTASGVYNNVYGADDFICDLYYQVIDPDKS
jgi:prepilin-type N-terminal cleavage/methylation domain-containing protein